MLVVAPATFPAQQTVERVVAPDPGAASFDLAKVKVGQANGCADQASGTDIVVCGHRKAMDIDISQMPDFAEKPIRAGVDLPGGARVNAVVEPAEIGGARSNRAMVRLKLPF